jgi:hypothetical protein
MWKKGKSSLRSRSQLSRILTHNQDKSKINRRIILQFSLEYIQFTPGKPFSNLYTELLNSKINNNNIITRISHHCVGLCVWKLETRKQEKSGHESAKNKKKKNRKKWGGLEFVKNLLCVCLCNNIILLKTSTTNNT